MLEGRERRRRGVVNRLRRLAYGLMLSCSLPVTAGQPAAAPSPRSDRGAESASSRSSSASIQGLLAMVANLPADPATPLGTDDDYGHLAFEDVALRLEDPRGSAKLRLQLMPMERLRDGLGLHVQVPDLGALHLTLYARRGGGAARSAWSLGGSMELVRMTDGSRQLAFVPELSVDGDVLLRRDLGFSAAVRYAHWRGTGAKDAQDFEVPQLLFRWNLRT